MAPAQLSQIPGLPESSLTARAVSELPEETAPAPWTCRAQAVLWSARPSRAAHAALPPSLSARRPLLVLGGLVRYLTTPVGAYDEVFAIVLVRHGRRVAGHVPFMAVSSAHSAVGGRANWSLPKVLADFTGTPAAGEEMTASAETWSVAATASAPGGVLPAIPLRSAATMLQEWPDRGLRAASMSARGRVRPALVQVRSAGAPRFTELLGGGPHPGVLVESCRFQLGLPRPAQP